MGKAKPKAGGTGKAAANKVGGLLGNAAAKSKKARRRNAAGASKPAPPPKPMSGPVVLKVPPKATKAERAQFSEYVKYSNEANRKGKLSKSGRVSSRQSGARRAAEREARAERLRAKNAGTPYQDVAAHMPDATWLGHGTPHKWGDHTKLVNSSIAGQQNRYPIGYKPTIFKLK